MYCCHDVLILIGFWDAAASHEAVPPHLLAQCAYQPKCQVPGRERWAAAARGA